MTRLPRALRRPVAGRLSPPARAGLILLLKPWASWAAHAAITGRARSRTDPVTGRFTRAEVNALLREAWNRLGQLTPELPAEPTPGSRQNVLLAALTLAMFQALLDDGIERRYGIELTGDTCWKIYAQWGQIPRLIARLRTRDPARRVRIAVDMFLSYPFNPPGYIRQDQPEPQGRALDILRCPVAEYLAAHGAADLAAGSWCNLDFPLARMWGGTLQRRETLASGARQCDFRFLATCGGEDRPYARLRKQLDRRDVPGEGLPVPPGEVPS
jgi:L-2-amino-thiazoline-4-carboxylic acid hydrolase